MRWIIHLIADVNAETEEDAIARAKLVVSETDGYDIEVQPMPNLPEDLPDAAWRAREEERIVAMLATTHGRHIMDLRRQLHDLLDANNLEAADDLLSKHLAAKAGIDCHGENEMKYYLLHVYGDVEPILHGPYKTAAMRDRGARTVRHADPELRDGLFRIDSKCAVTVDSYTGAELETTKEQQ